MLIFICDVCEQKFEAGITARGIVYTTGGMHSKRVLVENENDACFECQEDINNEKEKVDKEIRAKIKAKKRNHETANNPS